MHPEQYISSQKQSLHRYSPTSFMHCTQSPGVVRSPKPSARSNSSKKISRYRSQSAILVCQDMTISLCGGIGTELTLSFSLTILCFLRFATGLIGGCLFGSWLVGVPTSSTMGVGSSCVGFDTHSLTYRWVLRVAETRPLVFDVVTSQTRMISVS